MIRLTRLSAVWALAQLLAVVALGHCADEAGSRKDLPKTFDYEAYVQKYGKSYNHVETLSRAKLFYARTMGIFKLNSLYVTHKSNHYLKQNEYTDMTPAEMKQSLVSTDIDLIPIAGAEMMPNAPADEFMIVSQDGIKDGFSQMSLSAPPVQRKPTVNFFSEPVDSDKLQAPEADITSNKPANTASKLTWSDEADRATDMFANAMLEDFLGNIAPYPRPVIPKRKVLGDDDLPQRPAGRISELMGSIRTFYDYFAKVDEVVAADEDELKQERDNDAEREDSANSNKKEEEAPASEGTIFDIDWRRTNCIGKPKSQSKCNACYAFATLDLMEFFYCRQKKAPIEFSAQYVIDCGKRSDLNGCQGGKLSNVGLFIQKYGLHLDAAYPYEARQKECPYDGPSGQEQTSQTLKPTISGWRMFPEIQAWYKWLPKSPIIVGINMPSDFLAYGGGVHDGADCTPGMVHAMLLVGSGKQDGKPFWLLKNTFAESWGEEGYFKLSKKAPIKCFNSAIVARANFDQ